jgi:hypothetical protein
MKNKVSLLWGEWFKGKQKKTRWSTSHLQHQNYLLLFKISNFINQIEQTHENKKVNIFSIQTSSQLLATKENLKVVI